MAFANSFATYWLTLIKSVSQPGRPRVVKALRYGLQVALHERAEVLARKRQETGCFVLLTNVPTAGEMGHRAGAVLRAYKEQHGIEQKYRFG